MKEKKTKQDTWKQPVGLYKANGTVTDINFKIEGPDLEEWLIPLMQNSQNIESIGGAPCSLDIFWLVTVGNTAYHAVVLLNNSYTYSAYAAESPSAYLRLMKDLMPVIRDTLVIDTLGVAASTFDHAAQDVREALEHTLGSDKPASPSQSKDVSVHVITGEALKKMVDSGTFPPEVAAQIKSAMQKVAQNGSVTDAPKFIKPRKE